MYICIRICMRMCIHICDVSTTKVFASYIQVLYVPDEDLRGSKRRTIKIYTVLRAMFQSSVTFESVAMSLYLIIYIYIQYMFT